MSLITYLDRICISAAAPRISHDLGLTDMQLGYVFSIFALSYAIFELPAGWLGDRVGQRKVLARIVAGWSVFTCLTGMAWNYPVLLVTRFAFGAAEAGAFPTLARALARWFPPHERGFPNGVLGSYTVLVTGRQEAGQASLVFTAGDDSCAKRRTALTAKPWVYANS